MNCDSYFEAREKFKASYTLSLNEKSIDSESLKKEILFTKVEFYSQIVNNNNDTNNQVQKKAKQIAKQSLIRKQGLTNCINDYFKDAIRLSIHFQPKDSEKLGLKLIDKAINLGSPWFNIIFKCEDGDIILGKKDWFRNNRTLIDNKYYQINDVAKNQFVSNNVSKVIKEQINVAR